MPSLDSPTCQGDGQKGQLGHHPAENQNARQLGQAVGPGSVPPVCLLSLCFYFCSSEHEKSDIGWGKG